MALSPLAQVIYQTTATDHGAYSEKELANFEIQADCIDGALSEIVSLVSSAALAYLSDAHKEAFELTLTRKISLNQFADHVLPSMPNWWHFIAGD